MRVIILVQKIKRTGLSFSIIGLQTIFSKCWLHDNNSLHISKILNAKSTVRFTRQHMIFSTISYNVLVIIIETYSRLRVIWLFEFIFRILDVKFLYCKSFLDKNNLRHCSINISNGSHYFYSPMYEFFFFFNNMDSRICNTFRSW